MSIFEQICRLKPKLSYGEFISEGKRALISNHFDPATGYIIADRDDHVEFLAWLGVEAAVTWTLSLAQSLSNSPPDTNRGLVGSSKGVDESKEDLPCMGAPRSFRLSRDERFLLVKAGDQLILYELEIDNAGGASGKEMFREKSIPSLLGMEWIDETTFVIFHATGIVVKRVIATKLDSWQGKFSANPLGLLASNHKGPVEKQADPVRTLKVIKSRIDWYQYYGEGGTCVVASRLGIAGFKLRSDMPFLVPYFEVERVSLCLGQLQAVYLYGSEYFCLIDLFASNSLGGDGESPVIASDGDGISQPPDNDKHGAEAEAKPLYLAGTLKVLKAHRGGHLVVYRSFPIECAASTCLGYDLFLNVSDNILLVFAPSNDLVWMFDIETNRLPKPLQGPQPSKFIAPSWLSLQGRFVLNPDSLVIYEYDWDWRRLFADDAVIIRRDPINWLKFLFCRRDCVELGFQIARLSFRQGFVEPEHWHLIIEIVVQKICRYLPISKSGDLGRSQSTSSTTRSSSSSNTTSVSIRWDSEMIDKAYGCLESIVEPLIDDETWSIDCKILLLDTLNHAADRYEMPLSSSLSLLLIEQLKRLERYDEIAALIKAGFVLDAARVVQLLGDVGPMWSPLSSFLERTLQYELLLGLYLRHEKIRELASLLQNMERDELEEVSLATLNSIVARVSNLVVHGESVKRSLAIVQTIIQSRNN